MKRFICILLSCLLLCACGAKQPEAVETAAVTETTIAKAETMPIVRGPERLTRRLLDNYEVDAEVISGGVEYAVTAEMVPLNRSAGELLTAVMPEDTSGRSEETQEFRRIVTTEQGSSITLTDSYFSAFRGGYTKEDLWEMEILLKGWEKEHPEEAVHTLDFMTPEEAMIKALELFQQLNVGYEPNVECFAGLTGSEINAYQQVCLDDPMYTEFGTFHMLPELGADHDAYYLSFSFAFNGIPLENPGIMSNTYGAVFAPDAVMLITRQGIAYISCMGLQSLYKAGESRRLLTAEECLDGVKQLVQTFYAEESYKTTLIELRYLALPKDGKTTLVPYWGMEVLDQGVIDITPPGTHPYPICYWFNAFTGAHYMDE